MYSPMGAALASVLKLSWKPITAAEVSAVACRRSAPTDHMIVLGERHLRRAAIEFAAYYNRVRAHRALDLNCPFRRAIERCGAIKSRSILGGLHHQYCRVDLQHAGRGFWHTQGIPVGMIFVRNENGSHNPAEHMEIDDSLGGTAVMTAWLQNSWHDR
jgi:hypothetical protein